MVLAPVRGRAVYKDTFGFKVRRRLDKIEKTLGPWIVKIIPSFIVAHYVYILFWCIIGSILIYPQKNIKYIDALFFAVGASTQAGLNTIDMNKLTLFQQMVTYIIGMLTTPIFIHGSLTFLRLYWFEKYFDDIKQSAKNNYRMRRTATLAALRTQTMDSRRRTRSFNAAESTAGVGFDISKRNRSYQEAMRAAAAAEAVAKEETSPSTSGSTQKSNDIELENLPPLGDQASITESIDSEAEMAQASVEHLSEPSDSEEDVIEPIPESMPPPSVHSQTPSETVSPSESPPAAVEPVKDIKFANLPHPPKRGHIEPRDMYMSIAMMQKNKDMRDENTESGPALVISGPAERESHRPHRHRHRHQHHHHRPHHSSRSPAQMDIDHLTVENTAHNATVDDALRQTPTSIQFAVPELPRTQKRFPPELDEVEEQENSEADEEDPIIKRTQSHHVGMPGTGNKLPKRSMTLDPFSKTPKLIKSSSFERMVRRKWRKSHPLRKLSRRLTLTRTRSGLDPRHPTDLSFTSEDDSDSEDEEQAINFTLPPHRTISTNYLSWTPALGRNSTFIALTDEQKQELGGVEYCALKLLSKILVLYYVGFHILAFTFFIPWIVKHTSYVTRLRVDGIAPAWWAFYNAASTFNDLGLTLTPDSFVMFAQDCYVLLISSFFIVVGNTGFPVFLRFIIWIMFKLAPEFSQLKESLGFLLDHPRRCFTLLFPSGPTWWLLFILIVLNAVDWVLFIILDYHSSSLSSLSGGYRVLDGLFQAFSTRTAGFLVVNLSLLHPAIQVSYLVMMYISVLPLAISIRRTNVYEEQSLGVYYDNDSEVDQDLSATNFIGTHLRKQLSFDLWFLFLGLFIICICENGKMRDNTSFGVFQVMFEITSAYGTVGLSLGYPGTDASFCSQFTVISKLVVIAMMIRGRHRGLPYSLDRAIMLPDDKMQLRDEVQAQHAFRRTHSMSRSATGYTDSGSEYTTGVSTEEGHSFMGGALRRVGRASTGIKRKLNSSVSGRNSIPRYYDFPLRSAETQPVTRQASRQSMVARQTSNSDHVRRTSVSTAGSEAHPMFSYNEDQFSGTDNGNFLGRIRSNFQDIDPRSIVSKGEKIIKLGGTALKRTMSL